MCVTVLDDVMKQLVSKTFGCRTHHGRKNSYTVEHLIHKPLYPVYNLCNEDSAQDTCIEVNN